MSPPETEFGKLPPGFRLPNATHVGRVRLQVADLDRSLAFYHDVLGLMPMDVTDGWASLGAHSSHRAGSGEGVGKGHATQPLVELHERRGAAPVPRRGRLGLFHFAILLPNRPSLARFARALADRAIPFGASDHLVSEALYLQDPDGLGIEVYADRPRSEWVIRGGELAMTTEPLDFAELERAMNAGPDPRDPRDSRDSRDSHGWTGMPEGTTMGHVHLHVGDLARADAFYHAGLGLDRTVWSYPGALFLSAGGYHHHLGVNTWAAGAAPAGEDEARLLEWELVVPSAADRDAAFESLASAGFTTDQSIDGGTIRDPWGTQLRIRAAKGA